MAETIAETAAAAERASERLEGRIVRTPVKAYAPLAAATGADVQLKLENLQHTGSFKLRGALNRLLTLDPGVRSRGVVVASSGNHGAASARAMRDLGVDGLVVVPESVSPVKLDAIRTAGAEVLLHGADGLQSERHARELAERQGLYYLSPYNDPEVIAGQGSIGVELREQLPELDVAVIAVGGGGLLAGTASVLKSANPDIRIVAAQPEASPVMTRSVEAGRIVSVPETPTLSDGTAGGIEEGAITFELVAALCDDFVLVSEFEIAMAMTQFAAAEASFIEGAAAVPLAAILKLADELDGLQVMALICGGNVAAETTERALAMAGIVRT
ncbi:MAG: threonine/serine dehydratase [Pseudomonadota bacterium]